MRTPWGETAELQQDRLASGHKAIDRAAADDNHRRRLLGAMVAAIAERGYAKATTNEVAALAGVSSNALYKLFGSKEACFLAAIDELREFGMARIREGYGRPEQWEERIRAAFEELLRVLVEQPAAAHVYVVDVYEAGPEGNKRVKEGLADFEGLLAEGFARSPTRAGVPDEVIAAIVAGIQMVIHDHLRCGAIDELPELAAQLGDWALGYETPPEPLPDGSVTAPQQQRRDDDQDEDVPERIVRAVAEVCARDGVTRLTVDAIASTARISLSTLYKHFPGGAEEAFLSAFEEIVRRCLECSRSAYTTEETWPAKMHAVNRELFLYLASEPALAKTALVEVLGGGRNALEQRDLSLAPFEGLLEGGQLLAPRVPAVVRKAIVFAVYSLVGREIEAGGAERLARLAPTATYIELAPYLGAERAAEVANEIGPVPPTPPAGEQASAAAG